MLDGFTGLINALVTSVQGAFLLAICTLVLVYAGFQWLINNRKEFKEWAIGALAGTGIVLLAPSIAQKIIAAVHP